MNRNKAMNGLGGLMFLLLGLYFVNGALQLDIGTARRMGPGFFPLVLGCIVSGLALLVIIQSWYTQVVAGSPDWWAFAKVSTSVIVFSLGTYYFGVIPGTCASVLVSTLGENRLKLHHKVLLALSVSFMAWLIFIVALQLPFTAFRLP